MNGNFRKALPGIFINPADIKEESCAIKEESYTEEI
jgi:hypothetical protein